ncbi:MAG TPA: signal peptide peptidase SppA [bacterium]
MARLKYPFIALAGLSAAAALLLLLAGGRGERRVLPQAPFGAERVAVVELTGIMTGSQDAGSRATSARRVVEQLEKHRDDATVKAVVLRIDSPGGTVVAAQEITAALGRLRGAGKKLVTSMGDMAASGGFYVACGTDHIVASPGTLTGSIGVIMQFPNYQGLFGKLGLSTNTIKSGEFKDVGNGAREMTERDRRLLQALVDDVQGQFVAAVAAGRRMRPDRVGELADGRVYSGRQAKELGLVDELGDLDTAIAAASRLAGIAGKPEVLREKPRRRLWEMLDARFAALFPAPLQSESYLEGRPLYLWQ